MRATAENERQKVARPIRVLLAEDNASDAELILHELRRAGFEPEWHRVDTEAAYLEHLHAGLDIVLSDYQMPEFGAPRALELLQQRGLDVPFIIVSGVISEETAVTAMKQGAADYLLKDRLTRLGSAVSQAMEQGELRKQRKQVGEALRLFRTLVDQSDDTFEVIDPKTARFLDVNAKGPAELGYTREEYLSLRVLDIDLTITESAWPQLVAKLRAAGSLSSEGRHRRKDGTSFPIEFSAKWVRLDRDYVIAAVRDISARKQSEERIREQAAMLDQAHDAIIVRDIHTRRITFWNRGAERLYGWTAAEAEGRNVGELILTDPRLLDTVTETLLKDGEWRGETRQVTKAGKELTVGGHVTLVRDSQGAPKSALAINFDVTEQKNLEARFLRAQRLESIGTLASGVAHDLNNILAPIMMSVPLLRRDLNPRQREEIITTIEMSAERGAEIVKQVLTFGRGVEGERRPLQATALIQELTKIMRQTFPKDITVESSLDPQLWQVIGDATQIHQVLLNLCVNARDAMPDGGKLRVTAANLELDPSYCSMLPEATPGPHVLLKVSDSGTGIPQEVVERIFDPFFTTKGVGNGTGLGLSTALGIVKSHGGFMHVNTEPGKGTTFNVYLPAAPDHETAPTTTLRAHIPKGHGELVLVVDDEPSIGAAARTVLETHSYRVLLAADGTEALAVFAQNSGRIAAVLTDLMMPFMDGVALTRALRQMKPGLPIVASTGLGEKAQLDELKALGVASVLHKPYGADTLLRCIHQALHPEGNSLTA
jgi:PAS domain S-box-containing protein